MAIYRKPDINLLGLILAICNFKGGCGKTTSAVTFAHQFAARGKRVLLLDMDSQANLTAHLCFPEDEKGSIGQALYNAYTDWTREQFEDQVVSVKVTQIREPMDLVAGTSRFEENLSSLDIQLRKTDDQAITQRLARCLEPLRAFYDIILIDTPPSLNGLIVDLVLNAADTVLIPVDGFMAVSGMIALTQRIDTAHKKRLRNGGRPLQTLIYCPHYIMDDSSPPVGPFQVRNSDWYPLLMASFPKHFLLPAVRHTVSPTRSIRPGETWASLTRVARQDYQNLFQALNTALSDQTLPPFTVWKEQAGYDMMDTLTKAVWDDLHKTPRERNVIKKVKFIKNPPLPSPEEPSK